MIPLVLVVIGLLVLAGAFALRTVAFVSTRTTETAETRPLRPMPAGVKPSAPTRTTKTAVTEAPPSDALMGLLLALGATIVLIGVFYPKLNKAPLKEASIRTPFGSFGWGAEPQAAPSSGPVETKPSEPAARADETPASLLSLLEQEHLAHLHLVQAQARLPGMREARVAIVGLGLDPELQRQAAFADQVEAPRALYGTEGHHALMAAQVGFVAALARSARILPICIFDAFGRSGMSEVLRGLDAARAWGPHIVFLDFGVLAGGEEGAWRGARPLLERLAADALVIGPAGNGAESLPAWPAREASVLGVAATATPSALAAFSSRGVELAAPGVDLLALAGVADGQFVFERRSGTSLAAGVVTAVAALAWAADPSPDPERMRTLLVGSGRHVDEEPAMAALDVDAVVAAIAG